MIKDFFSLKNLIEKIIGFIGALILILIGILYPSLVSLFAKVPSEALAKIILVGFSISFLMVVLLIIVTAFLYSQIKELNSRYEFVSYFGARWRIQRSKKVIYEKPFCNCPGHDPVECKFVEYNAPIRLKLFCPTKTPHYDYDMIRLTDASGKELTIEEAVDQIKEREFGKSKKKS